jgi:hypothetical protein
MCVCVKKTMMAARRKLLPLSLKKATPIRIETRRRRCFSPFENLSNLSVCVVFRCCARMPMGFPPERPPPPFPPLRMQRPPPFSSYPSKLIGITSRRTLVGL